jgi:Papain-like cysteine protease AvrRpt2/Putative Ig domain
MHFLPRLIRALVYTFSVPLLVPLTLHCGGGSSSSTPTAPVPAPSNLSYSQASLVATVGVGITPDQASVTGTVASFSITPGLPAGLALNSVTGSISGTPTAASPATSYTVTATNATGYTTTIIQIKVNQTSVGSFQTLNCPQQIQEHSQWCWAASGASILAFLGTPQTQCNIVNYVRSINYACGNATFAWSDPTANIPIEALYGPAPSVTDFMAHYGKPCTGSSAALTFPTIQAEIGANRPFYVNWAWSTGGGHILLGIGWDTRNSGQEVTIMDPWTNEGIKLVSYTWLCTGSDPVEGNATHTWQWSLKVNP